MQWFSFGAYFSFFFLFFFFKSRVVCEPFPLKFLFSQKPGTEKQYMDRD